MRCCGRWGCPPSTSRPVPRSGPGCTGRSSPQIPEPVLVIADNASSEAQARPLLPGAGPHKVLVTSRHTLAGLGARLVDVTVLDEDGSIELLDAAVRAARPDDDRISGDQEAAGRLAGMCGGLPLALQITAALLKADPALAAAELADELAPSRTGCSGWPMTTAAGRAAPSVAAAFELSYRRLDETAARVFRLLPVDPGPDVSTAAAAVLADLPVGEVRSVLAGWPGRTWPRPLPARVAGGGCMTCCACTPRGCPTITRTPTAGSRPATGCSATTCSWQRPLTIMCGRCRAWRYRRSSPAETMPWHGWMRERASLVAAVSMAADTGRDQAAVSLPLLLAEYFGWRRRFDDWLATMTISLNAARRLGDRPVRAPR